MMFRPTPIAATAVASASAANVATDRAIWAWLWPRHRGPLLGAPATPAASCTPRSSNLAAPMVVGWAAPAYLRRQRSGDRVRGVT